MVIRERYLKAIRGFYDSDLIKVITGVRRCGKSVILETIMNEIKKKTTNIIYLNFEKMTDFEFDPVTNTEQLSSLKSLTATCQSSNSCISSKKQ